MSVATSRFDITEHLRNEDKMHPYIGAAFEEAGDGAASIANVLGDVPHVGGIPFAQAANGNPT